MRDVLSRSTVTDTGPLISLEKLAEGFAFIRRRYDRLIVPPAVLDEVCFRYESSQAYLQHFEIEDLMEVRHPAEEGSTSFAEGLHQGEIEAIQLARSLDLPLLIEEKLGRDVARRAGIRISGVAGQIVQACREGDVTAVQARTMLDQMLAHNRINVRIHQRLTAHIDRAT